MGQTSGENHEENYWSRRRRVTRRGFLRGAGMAAGVAAVGPMLAACGGGGNNKTTSSKSGGAAPAGATQAAAATAAARANPVDAVDLTGKKVEVQFWHTQQGSSADKLNAIVTAFNSSQPSVTIKPTFQGNYNDLFKKIQAAVAAGQVPDVAVSYPDQVSEYQSANVVIPLEDYLSSTKYGLTATDQADYVKAYVDENRYAEYGGKLLSFPFTKSVLSMFYNEDKLKAANITVPAPDQWTWDAWVAANKAVTSGTTKGYAIAVDASTFDGMVYSRGGTLISSDQKHWLFNQQAGQDTLSMYEDAIKSGWGYQIAKQYADQTDFGAGRAIFTLATSSGLAFYKKEVDGAAKFNWNVAVIPHSPGVSPVTTLYGASIAVFKTSPEKQLGAWLFMKYFTTPSVTADWSVATGYLPVRTSAVQSEAVQAQIKALPSYGVVVNTIGPVGRPETSVKGTEDTRNDITDAMTKVLGDPSTNVKTLLDQTVQKGDQALAQA
jgi:multiple sugar transport system substrate-binding protein